MSASSVEYMQDIDIAMSCHSLGGDNMAIDLTVDHQ